jgi:hypothetical protein
VPGQRSTAINILILDRNEQALAYVYFEDEPGRRSEHAPTVLSEGISALALLQMVYRGAVKVSAQQMRAAIESLPYEQPKLCAVAVGYLSGEDFAARRNVQSRFHLIGTQFGATCRGTFLCSLDLA